MNIPCNKVSQCLLVNPPYLNLSSEAPDRLAYFGFSWGGGFGGAPGGGGAINPGGPLDNTDWPGQPGWPGGTNSGNPGTSGSGYLPPLGSFWTQWSCLGMCVSFVSQMNADLCAIIASLECLYNGDPGSGGDPNFPPPVDPNTGFRYTLYYNLPQTASASCPDGTTRSFTVPAFTFSSISLVEANNKAYSFALAQAHAITHCPPSKSCCAGVPISSNYDVYNVHSQLFGIAPFVFTVDSGTLPLGLSLVQTGPQIAKLSGTPITPGVYHWTVIARSGQYEIAMPDVIKVLGINQTTLPDGTSGQPYSQQISYSGNNGAVTFTPGAFFPSWASLSSTGLITGTPP